MVTDRSVTIYIAAGRGCSPRGVAWLNASRTKIEHTSPAACALRYDFQSRCVSFNLPPGLLGRYLDPADPLAAAAAEQGPNGAPPALHLDLTPVPVPAGPLLPGQKPWQERHQALLGRLLEAPGPAGRRRYRADEARTLQLTGSEVELVRAQPVSLRRAVRALKAWRAFGGHGAAGAAELAGAACEVLVMAAAGPEQLTNPLPAPSSGAPAPAAPEKPLLLFARALRLAACRLRRDERDPILVPVFYGNAIGWEPAAAPFTPIILHPAGEQPALGAARPPKLLRKLQHATPTHTDGHRSHASESECVPGWGARQ
jgi:hypothetical protein